MRIGVEIAVVSQPADCDRILLVAWRLSLLVGVKEVHPNHIVFDEGASVRHASLVRPVVQTRVHMAEHDVPRVRAFGLDHVQHAMRMTLPAREMNGKRSAAELGGARGASQHLLLRGCEVLADPDLADDAGANFGLVLRQSAVSSDRLADHFDAHVFHVRRMRRFKVEARAHDDVQSASPADSLQRRRITPDSEVGRIDDRFPAILDEMIELLDCRSDIEQSAIVAIEKRVHPQVADHRYVERPFGDRDL